MVKNETIQIANNNISYLSDFAQNMAASITYLIMEANKNGYDKTDKLLCLTLDAIIEDSNINKN